MTNTSERSLLQSALTRARWMGDKREVERLQQKLQELEEKGRAA